MVGFLGVLLLLAAIGGFGSYWITWEMQDSRSRPAFSAKLMSDLAMVLRGRRAAIAMVRVRPRGAGGQPTRAPESSST
jgi:hypothetical protein